MTCVGWVDVFSRKNHRDAIIEAMDYCIQNKGLNIYAYCLMTNHLHMVVNCNEPHQLSDTIRDFKKHTAKQILFQITNQVESRRRWMLDYFSKAKTAKHKSYKLWQAGNHAIELYNENFAWTKINYIHKNPVAAGFVRKPEDWVYSSASNYLGAESVLEGVYCILPPLGRV